jgi:hypothetical protein
VATEGTKSWWETLPGLLTGLSAVIVAVTGAAVAYINAPASAAKNPNQALKERYFILESIDVPRTQKIEALRILAHISVGSRTWSFPLPQQSVYWYVGSTIGKIVYPLPPTTDEATVTFNVEYLRSLGGEQRPEQTHVSAPIFVKAPSGNRTTVFEVNCPPCATLSPALDKPVATLHFAISDKIP